MRLKIGSEIHFTDGEGGSYIGLVSSLDNDIVSGNILNVYNNIFYGKKAPQNPWKSTTLEWTASQKHIHGNWQGKIPEVHRWPYDFSVPGAKDDFIPQTTPPSEVVHTKVEKT